MLSNKQLAGIKKWLKKQEQAIKDRSDSFFIGSDCTRLKILWLLRENKELCVSDLAKVLGVSVSGISHQLSLLERAGLVTKVKTGQMVCYFLADNSHHHKILFS